MSTTRQKASSGARKVVSTCMDLRPGQELLIFCDDTTLDVARLIHRAAFDLQVRSTLMFVPLEDQTQYANGIEFPLPLQSAIRDAHAILLCLTDAPAATRFRVKIINDRKFGQRIANCPGMNLDMLATAVDVDYHLMINQCSLLATVLAKGTRVEIKTRDASGQPHSLNLALSRWERIPMSSTGLLKEGVWGNIPSGETFVVPVETATQGDIVINGSLPGYVFQKGEAITLTFEGGRLVRVVPEMSAGALHLLHILNLARDAGDTNCELLGEVGIGVNPGVKRLIGKSLLDEKKAGTVHIGLGRNLEFGGTIESRVHHDLVTDKPTLLVDNRTVLDEGQMSVREVDWRESYLRTTPPSAWDTGHWHVARTGHRVQVEAQLLHRELIDSARRKFPIPVGDNATAKLAARIYDKIPRGNSIAIDELSVRAKLDRRELLALLALMEDYDIINVKLHSLAG